MAKYKVEVGGFVSTYRQRTFTTINEQIQNMHKNRAYHSSSRTKSLACERFVLTALTNLCKIQICSFIASPYTQAAQKRPVKRHRKGLSNYSNGNREICAMRAL